MVVSQTEFINMIRTKNQLVRFSGSELEEIYSDVNDMLTFIDTIALLSDHESAFLLFDDAFRDKICTVLQQHRFNCDDEVKSIINDVIGYLNGLRSYPKGLAAIIKNSYLSFQEQTRHVEFESTDALLSAVAEDAVVFDYLQNGEEGKLGNSDCTIMSLNYFTEVYPEIFKDKEMLDRALSLLDRASRESRILSTRKKYVKESRQRVMNANKNEE